MSSNKNSSKKPAAKQVATNAAEKPTTKTTTKVAEKAITKTTPAKISQIKSRRVQWQIKVLGHIAVQKQLANIGLIRK